MRGPYLLRVQKNGVLAVFFCVTLSPILCAQTSSLETKALTPSTTLKGHQGAAIRVTVLDAHNAPLTRQALVSFHAATPNTTAWQVTGDDSQALFVDPSFGRYDIEASAVGYLSARTTLDVAGMGNTIDVKLVLSPDPSADRETDSSLPPRTLREINRAVRALRADDLREAQKRLDEAGKSSPSSARVKYLLGYVALAKGDPEQAQTLLEQATSLNPGNGPAWSLLGRVRLLNGDAKQAVKALEQSVGVNPDNWVAHNLLADAYLDQHEYEKARQQAQLAIRTGEQEGTAAQLALGEALANLGERPQAITALKIFLSNHPRSIAAQHADELLRRLEHVKAGDKWTDIDQQLAAFDIANDLLVAPKAELPVTPWMPANIDRNKPSVVAGLSCPYRQVMDGAADRVQELVTNVQRIVAVESIVYERPDPTGNSGVSDTRKFDYAATLSQQPSVVLVDEYRSQRYDQALLPDHIADNGFAVLALVFHPAMRDAFEMTCEGLGEWRGHPAWLVRFQQRDDQPPRLQAYRLGEIVYPVSLKGRAWIAADTFQPIRIETDLVHPMANIQLLAQHIATEYVAVPFRKSGLEIYLPQTAEIYLHFRGQRYFHKHLFDNYMVFTVSADDGKIREAKQDSEVPNSANPGLRGAPGVHASREDANLGLGVAAAQ